MNRRLVETLTHYAYHTNLPLHPMGNGEYLIPLGGSYSITCKVVDDFVRVITLFGSSGIYIPEHRRAACLEFINMLNVQRPLIFCIEPNGHFSMVLPCRADGFDLPESLLGAHLQQLVRFMQDENIENILLNTFGGYRQ